MLATRIDTITERNRAKLHEHWGSCLGRVRREHAVGAPSSLEPKPAPIDPLEQINKLRQVHASLGADRAAATKARSEYSPRPRFPSGRAGAPRQRER